MLVCTGKDQGGAFKGCGDPVSKYGSAIYKLCVFCNKKRLSKNRAAKKPTGEANLFEKIWGEREHFSFLSGKPLDGYTGDLWYNLFAHVLSKAQNKYPEFILYEKNIVLLTPKEHDLFDKGSSSQRRKYAEETGCIWDKLFELKSELIEEYEKER